MSTLSFDPDCHPEDTLKAFDEFVQRFELRYDAQFPDPPKVSMDSAIERWKLCSGDPTKLPTVDEYDQIRNTWISHDKVAKFLGMYSSNRFYEDWKSAVPLEENRKKCTWNFFLEKMKSFYKPTENLTIKNYQFRSLCQENSETFIAFCNRVDREARHCNLKCDSDTCTAQDTAIRDQILIGTTNEKIREEALKRSWDLATLRKDGMQLESALRGASELSNENGSVNKLGKYAKTKLSVGNSTDFKAKNSSVGNSTDFKTKSCYRCGLVIQKSISQHVRQCKAKNSKCEACGKIGHLEIVCRSNTVKNIDEHESEKVEDDPTSDTNYTDVFYPTNIYQIMGKQTPNNFDVEVILNNNFVKVLADTGAKVSVCSESHAKLWGLTNKMLPSSQKLKPYNSEPIPVLGVSRCAVTFGQNSIPVLWHIIKGSCLPILSGNAARELGIIKFNSKPDVFNPINMISASECKEQIQDILLKYNENFNDLGKLRNHQVKFHTDPTIKPINQAARTIPYHLQERANEVLETMLKQDVIEEHPTDQPAPWISNTVISPKPDGSLRMTLDARNINKAILSSNLPIPRQEDIKAKLSGSKFFSKMDFRSAFWQLELHPDSRHLTVFHHNNKLYRYKRLTMGVKSAQGELNTALSPLFAHIKNAHLIHDDLIIAAKTMEEHNKALEEVMKAIFKAGITLNAPKCLFGAREIRFWGMIVNEHGVQPDPEKVQALLHITPPQTKQELISFLCMMQSNSSFIPNFSKHSAILRLLTKSNARFRWTLDHQRAYTELISRFKENALLEYFDMNKQSFIVTDAHETGLGAMLIQGDTLERAKPVAVISRTTTRAEKNYPQIDLEAMAIDYALRRFRNYIVGAPTSIQVITDQKPLCPIFNGKRKGSIRTERVKLRHQDICMNVIYQKGKINQSDYISRHATPIEKLPKEEYEEAEDLNNLLYMIHTTPIIDQIGISKIATETASDKTLQTLKNKIKSGKLWINQNDSNEVKEFKGILNELTITANGIILKDDRMVLPKSLQSECIALAHKGAHPGQSGLLRRLRYHFFFPKMNASVIDFVKNCEDCNVNVDKKTKEPIRAHKIPMKTWEKVSVDLFGPMPSSKHVVVVQDLASRFPAAKLVASTSSDKVIPALESIYDSYGNPDQQLSDNGPPFNSRQMQDFANKRDIELQKVPPYHPSSNPVENFMRPLGKAMKVGFQNKEPESKTLKSVLDTYRQTPHPQTKLPPASILFRDGMKTSFPRKTVLEEDILKSRANDEKSKSENEQKVNSSKYRKKSAVDIGDTVLVRNYKKTVKFEPIFMRQPFKVMDFDEVKNELTVQRGDVLLKRHLDDLKKVEANFENDKIEIPDLTDQNEFDFFDPDSEGTDTSYFDKNIANLPENLPEEDSEIEENMLRRGTRTRNPPSKYQDFELYSI